MTALPMMTTWLFVELEAGESSHRVYRDPLWHSQKSCRDLNIALWYMAANLYRKGDWAYSIEIARLLTLLTEQAS